MAFSVVASKTNGIHTIWIGKPKGATFKDFLTGIDPSGEKLSKVDIKLLSGIWADLQSFTVPKDTNFGSFRISVNSEGFWGASLILGNSPVKVDAEAEAEV